MIISSLFDIISLIVFYKEIDSESKVNLNIREFFPISMSVLLFLNVKLKFKNRYFVLFFRGYTKI